MDYEYYIKTVAAYKEKLRQAEAANNKAAIENFRSRIIVNLKNAAKANPEKTADILEAIRFYENYQISEKPSGAPRSNNADSPKSNRTGQKERDSSPASDEMMQFFDFYEPDSLMGFDSVIGLEEAKQAIKKYVINPVLYPEAYNYRYLDNKAILLEGPPGTGKTTFAKAVASEIHQPFALIRMSSLVNCYIGETAKNIDKAFSYLRDYAERNDCGITVFFDEFDEIGKSRSGDDKVAEAAVPALLRNLDGVKTNKSFLILANTNLKAELDRAIQERFRRQIYIPLPDETMRRQLYISKLTEVEEKYTAMLDFDAAAVQSEGLSGRDITYICDDFKYQLGEVKAGLMPENVLADCFTEQIFNRKKEKGLI